MSTSQSGWRCGLSPHFTPAAAPGPKAAPSAQLVLNEHTLDLGAGGQARSRAAGAQTSGVHDVLQGPAPAGSGEAAGTPVGPSPAHPRRARPVACEALGGGAADHSQSCAAGPPSQPSPCVRGGLILTWKKKQRLRKERTRRGFSGTHGLPPGIPGRASQQRSQWADRKKPRRGAPGPDLPGASHCPASPWVQ